MIEKYQLPEGWRWVRLGEACERPEYGYTTNSEAKEVGPKFLRITDIQDENVNWNSVPYCRCDDNDINRYLLKPGDILFARTGGTTGKSYLITNVPPKTVFASYLIRVRTRNELMPEYLYLFLQSNGYWEQVETNRRGGAQPGMNATLLSNIVLPLPPPSEQKRMVTQLQELMQEVQRARAACEKQLEAAKALPTAYLREVFEGEEAKRWERKRLGEACNVDSNQVLPNTADARKLPYIGLEQIEGGTGRIISTVNASDNKFIQSITFRFDSRHVLYGKLRPYLNKVATPDFEGRCTTELLPLLPENECNRHYLAWLMRRAETVEEAMRYKTGTRMPRADMDELFKMLIPLPPLPEQRRIATRLQELMQGVDKLRTATERQLQVINALPQAILRKAFRGEL